MEIEESFVKVGEKLDNLWGELSGMLDSEDRVTQGKALLRGFEIVKDFDRLKIEAIATITALLNRSDSVSDDERAASLIRGFEFGARLADTLHDEFRDIADGETKVVRLVDEIVRALNAISPGRVRLAELLDHPDAGVRALAGAYLIDLMPERVIPILRQVEHSEDANSAHFRAYITLLCWERERKSRFSGLSA
jgi:hypothetical protein